MLDQIISNNISTIQSEQLTKLMIFITSIGNKFAIAFFSIILLSLLIFHKKDYKRTKIFTITMGAAVILSQVLKELIQRIRPIEQLIEKTTYSFPSGHATLAMAFFGVLIYLFKDEIKNKTLKYSFITANILLIILISFSRIYLNVHWLTDVLAGLTLGLICITGAILTVKKIPYLKKNKLF